SLLRALCGVTESGQELTGESCCLTKNAVGRSHAARRALPRQRVGRPAPLFSNPHGATGAGYPEHVLVLRGGRHPHHGQGEASEAHRRLVASWPRQETAMGLGHQE
ncbi:unnamed protein product, partial [Discosporangium mesarthrocarpum]